MPTVAGAVVMLVSMFVGFAIMGSGLLASATLQAIYRVVLYRCSITGDIAAPFTPATVIDAWAPYRVQ